MCVFDNVVGMINVASYAWLCGVIRGEKCGTRQECNTLLACLCGGAMRG